MTDFLLPPDLGIAAATPNLDANTASFKSPTVGSTRSVERLGDALRFQFNFTTVNDDPAMKRQRGRLQAFLSSLRGQSARIWMTPPGAMLRGSFPATELFSNNDFSAGTASWGASQYALTALDRAVRLTRSQVTANGSFTQSATLGTGTPYSLRAFVNAGKGSAVVQLADSFTSYGNSSSQGMLEAAFTAPSAGSDSIGLIEFLASSIAGNYFDVKWTSLSRCAQIDNGVNLLLNSDTPGTGTGWSVNAATNTVNAAAGPDGTVVANELFETTANAAHYAFQTVTVPSAAADYTFGVFVGQASSPRGFCWVQISEATGGTNVTAYINLSTGAITNVSAGANWTIISTLAVNYGAGYFRFIVTARKTNAATSISVLVGPATAAGTNTYIGSAAAFLLTWRASFAPSSVPVAPVATTSAAVAGTLQTGLQLNLKGLPVSSQGLLLPGDYTECGLQLNQIASPLDSDAAGLGTAILTRPPRNSPADGTGFVVNNPMGRFLVTSNSTGWNEMPGRMSDASLELVEDISF